MYLRRKQLTALVFIYLVNSITALHRIRHHRKQLTPRSPYTSAGHGRTNFEWNENNNEIQADNEDNDPTAPYVFITISEVNVDSGFGPSKKFVELHIEPNEFNPPGPYDNPLAGWRLIFIKGTSSEVVISIDLSQHKQKEGVPYFIIGDRGIPNLDISLSNEKTESALEDYPLELDESPYGIILVVSRDPAIHEALSLPKSGRKYNPFGLGTDEEIKHTLWQNTWDLVVVGRAVPTNQCEFFTNLFPPGALKSNFKYLLRDRDSPESAIKDYSLNYCCSEKIQYSPECFKLGHPSPGAVNDCSGRRFILEMEINKIPSARMSGLFVDVNSPSCVADFPGVPPYRYALVHDHDYAAAVARVMQTNARCPSIDDYSEIDPKYRPEMFAPILEEVGLEAEDKKIYIKTFARTSFDQCVQHFSKPDDLLHPSITSWLHLQPDCRITCRVCETYFEQGWLPDKKHRSKIHTQIGAFSQSKYNNQKTVKDHMLEDVHLEAMHFFASLDAAANRREQLDIERRQVLREKERLQPTMNEVRLAYIELRARVSFRSHKLFMDGISKLNVNVGFKHRSAEALQMICTTLSNSFHVKLLRSLVKNNNYFSLICDGTTNRSVPYLVCLIQSLEDNQPIVYFWGLMVITTGESGYNMVEDLKVRVAQDNEKVPGFELFFKTRMIAFVSDSASNMAGIRNSFYTHLGDYVGRGFAMVKCGAHKLQRAILHAIDFPTDEPTGNFLERDRNHYFKSFAKINNQFYSFYMSRGSKRFQEFVELAEELELHAYRINYFFDVRWAASHKRCMETIYKNFDALNADLSRIANDKDDDDAGTDKATELYKHLKDKTFYVVVAEFVDMLAIFKSMSERFQSKGGIMAGNVEIIREGYQDFVLLKERPGAYLKSFLNRCSCENVCEKGECSLKEYDDCDKVIKDDVDVLEFRNDGKHTVALSHFRDQLYDRILQEIVSYFEPELLEAFEIFNPKNLQEICSTSSHNQAHVTLSQYYKEFRTIIPNAPKVTAEERLKKVCKFYRLECDGVLAKWTSMIHEVTTDLISMKLRNSDVSKFWSEILSRKNLDSEVTDLVKMMLATSFTSADAERAFSMVSLIKTPDRSSLSPSSLEHLVRIAFNGPDSLSDESIFEYTKEFVQVASRVDDPSAVGGRQAQPEAFKSFFSRSRIF